MAETPQNCIPAGELARKAQVALWRIRHWQDRGIITAAYTTPNGSGVTCFFGPEGVRVARLAAGYMMLGFNRDEIYRLLTTKKGQLGLKTREECLEVLAQLGRGEAELWKAVDQ